MAWLASIRLKSSNPEARRRAVESLAGSTKTHDTELLVASLEDRDPQVRCAAVQALEPAEVAGCSERLTSALEDPDSKVRATVARVLGNRGDAAAAGSLAQRLTDPCPEVRSSAAQALRRLRWKPRSAEELAWFQIALGNANAAVSAGNAALNPLVGELTQDTSFQRRAAAEALSRLSDPRRVEPLLNALLDPDASVRVSAVYALEPEKDEVVTTELLRLFRDPDPNVRMAAAQVLARRPSPPPAHFLPLLADSNFEVRLAAVRFLGKISHPQLVETLLPMMSDADNDVREAAAIALGQTRCVTAVQALVLALGDEERPVRVAAEKALMLIDPEWPQSEAARQASPGLVRLLQIRPGWVHSDIQQAINRIGAASKV